MPPLFALNGSSWLHDVSYGQPEIQLARYEVGHVDEVFVGAIVPGLGLGKPRKAVESLQDATGILALEPTQYSIPMIHQSGGTKPKVRVNSWFPWPIVAPGLLPLPRGNHAALPTRYVEEPVFSISPKVIQRWASLLDASTEVLLLACAVPAKGASTTGTAEPVDSWTIVTGELSAAVVRLQQRISNECYTMMNFL